MTMKAKAHSLPAVKAEPVYTITVEQVEDDVDIVLLKDGKFCVCMGFFDGVTGRFNSCYHHPASERAKDLEQAGIDLVRDVDGDYSVAIHSIAYEQVGAE